LRVAIFEAFFEFGNFQKKTRIDNVRNRHRVCQLERRLVEAALKQVLGQLAVKSVVLPTVVVRLEIRQMFETRLDRQAENTHFYISNPAHATPALPFFFLRGGGDFDPLANLQNAFLDGLGFCAISVIWAFLEFEHRLIQQVHFFVQTLLAGPPFPVERFVRDFEEREFLHSNRRLAF